MAPCDPEPPLEPATLSLVIVACPSPLLLRTRLPTDPRPTRHHTTRPARPTAALANAGRGTVFVTALAATACAAALAAARTSRRRARATNRAIYRATVTYHYHATTDRNAPAACAASRAAPRAAVGLSAATLAAHAAAASAAAALAATHTALTSPTGSPAILGRRCQLGQGVAILGRSGELHMIYP